MEQYLLYFVAILVLVLCFVVSFWFRTIHRKLRDIVMEMEGVKQEMSNSEKLMVEIHNQYLLEISAKIAKLSETYDQTDGDLYEKAEEIVREANNCSTSFIQRRMGIGYDRASYIVDLLERNGVVGPSEEGKPRKVYSEMEE